MRDPPASTKMRRIVQNELKSISCHPHRSHLSRTLAAWFTATTLSFGVASGLSFGLAIPRRNDAVVS